MRTKPFILTSVCGTVLLLVAAGTGLYINEMNQKNLANGEKVSGTQSTLKDELPNDLLSVDEIKTITLKEAPEASIHTIILEKSDKDYQYMTKLNNGTVIYFNARTGKRLSINHDDNVAAAAPINSSKINFNDARKIALDHNPSGAISKIELLTENGALSYCVWFGSKEHIDVRAQDGVVTHVDLKSVPPPQPKSNNSPQAPIPPAIDNVQERIREKTSININL